MTQTNAVRPSRQTHGSLILLVLIFAFTWLLLVARGLEFGFTGDVLDYAYHYDRLGTFGGMRWLVGEHLQRHLFAPLVSAPLAYLFPGQVAPWYAFLFLMHFVDALLVYLLSRTLLRGSYPWLSFAAALVFAFHGLQVQTLLDFPTGGHRSTALALALLSLWLFIQYRRRHNRWWLELSFVAYALTILIYEQTVLFFLLHPLIACFEDLRAGVRLNGRWWARVAADLIAFPLFVIGYLFLLAVLFPPSNQLSTSPAYIVSQFVGGLQLTVVPFLLVQLIGEVLTQAPLLLLLAVLVSGVLLVLVRRLSSPSAVTPLAQRDLLAYTVLGLAFVTVSILGVTPGNWAILEHPRSVYSASVGLGLLVPGLLALLGSWVPSNLLRGALFVVPLALWVGSGFAEFFVQQDVSQARADIRSRFFDAVWSTVPTVDPDNPPYLLIYTDAHPSTDLWLYAQDNRFTYSFDWFYGTHDLPVDVIYANLDASLAPPDDVPGSRYNGQFIVVEPEGIYSPLKPFVPIDPERLVIVHYDSQSETAQVVDHLPDAVRATANIVERTPLEWRTNAEMLPAELTP